MALATRVGAAQQSLKVCALLTPAVPNATAVVALQSNSTALGDLRITNEAMVAQLDGAPSGSQRFCTNATFVPSSEGFGTVPFTVKAVLPTGEILMANHSIAIRVGGNLPPVAGAARAVKTSSQPDGGGSYLSLGSWGMAEEWSMSLWLQPHVIADDVYMVTQHLSKGSNMFMLGFFQSSYWVRISCYRGCSTSATVALGFPVETGAAAVLSTGLTGDEVRLRMREPHHLALTFRCLSRGGNGTGPVGHLKVYQDGKLIGNKPNFGACMTLPLVPEAYRDDDWGNRPTPWEMGEEYDAGPLGGHLPDLPLVPSNFMDATFDEFVVWNASLSDAEILAVSRGGLPRTSDLNVRYNFDQDDAAECRERQLWDATATCFGINEAFGRTKPSKPFPWTNSAIGNVPHVPSPFGRVPGAWIHKALSAGTCVNATLLGSDADADRLTFRLVEVPRGAAVRLTGTQLELCDGNSTSTSAREVSVTFDVCDPFSLCASSVTGLGRVIFHILPVGPAVVAFQALRDDLALRLVFNTPTNCPFIGTLGALGVTLRLSDSAAALLGAYWETGCRALRLVLADPIKWFNSRPAEMRAQLLDGGLVRDAFESTYPSRGTSPLLTDLVCEAGELLFPGEVSCRPCPPGSIPMLNKTSSTKECTPCSAGSAGVAACSECPAGRFAAEVGLTQCELCPPGHFCGGRGMTSATACPSGTFGAVSGQTATKCELCDKGTWQDLLGSLSCKPCPSSKTTDSRGMYAEDSCQCPPGQYLGLDGSCAACPEGMTCSFGSKVANIALYLADKSLPIPQVNPGFYTRSSEPLSVYLCAGADTKTCPGGPPATCGGGLQGLVCQECPDGQAPLDGVCTKCDSSPSVLIYVVLPVAFCILALIMFKTGNDTVTVNVGVLLMVSVLLGLFVTTMQALALLPGLSIEWRSQGTFFSGFKFFLGNPDAWSGSIRLSCALSDKPLGRYLFSCLLPVLCVLAVLVVWGMSRAVAKVLRKEGWNINIMCNTLGLLLQTIFIGLAVLVVQPLRCYKHPNQKSSMTSFPQILCWGEDDMHTTLVVVGIILGLFYVIPFLALCIRATVQAPKSVDPVGHYQRWRFLLFRFRADVWWWGIVFLFRQLALAFSCCIPADSPQWQITYIAMVTTFYLIGLCWKQPWKNKTLNRVDLCSMLVVNFIIISSSAFIAKRSEDIQGFVVLHFVILAFFAIFVFYVFGASLYWAKVRGVRGDYGQGRNVGTISKAWADFVKVSASIDLDVLTQCIMTFTEFDVGNLVKAMGSFQSVDGTFGERLAPRLITIAHSSKDFAGLTTSVRSARLNALQGSIQQNASIQYQIVI